jgi:hypothetical protein
MVSQMTLDDLGNLGEVIGGAAVVVSLVYVALQVRQNTKQIHRSIAASKVASYQSVISAMTGFAASVTHGLGVARIYRRGLRDYESLAGDERQQFTMQLVILLYHYQSFFYQHRSGFVDSDLWEGHLRELVRLFRLPGVQAWWPRWRHAYSERFVKFLETQATRPAA